MWKLSKQQKKKKHLQKLSVTVFIRDGDHSQCPSPPDPVSRRPVQSNQQSRLHLSSRLHSAGGSLGPLGLLTRQLKPETQSGRKIHSILTAERKKVCLKMMDSSFKVGARLRRCTDRSHQVNRGWSFVCLRRRSLRNRCLSAENLQLEERGVLFLKKFYRVSFLQLAFFYPSLLFPPSSIHSSLSYILSFLSLLPALRWSPLSPADGGPSPSPGLL